MGVGELSILREAVAEANGRSRTGVIEASWSLSALRWQVAGLDFILVTLAAIAAWPIAHSVNESFSAAPVPSWLPFALSAGWITCLWLAGANKPDATDSALGVRLVLRGSVYFVAALALASYLAGTMPFRSAVILALMVGVPALVLGRLAVLTYVRTIRSRGFMKEHVTVLGSTDSSRVMAHKLSAVRRYRVSEVIDSSTLPADYRVSAALRRVKSSGATAVVVTDASDFGEGGLVALARGIDEMGIELLVAPTTDGLTSSHTFLKPVAGTALINVRLARLGGCCGIIKRALDIAVSGVMLILLAPVLFTIAVLIKVEDGGSIFFIQPRVGRAGSLFPFIKFRSMRINAHLERATTLGKADEGILDRYRNDDRITRIGVFIRRWSLDELPQLVNVFVGHMSLVGPRPVLEEELPQLDRAGLRRHLAKPGLTGLWQVSGRKELTWEERIRMDLQYVDEWSLVRDAGIIARTAGVVVKGTGAY